MSEAENSREIRTTQAWVSQSQETSGIRIGLPGVGPCDGVDVAGLNAEAVESVRHIKERLLRVLGRNDWVIPVEPGPIEFLDSSVGRE